MDYVPHLFCFVLRIKVVLPVKLDVGIENVQIRYLNVIKSNHSKKTVQKDFKDYAPMDLAEQDLKIVQLI